MKTHVPQHGVHSNLLLPIQEENLSCKGSGREYWTLLFTCRLHLVVSSCSTVACAYRAVACQGLLISEDPCPTLAMYVLDVQVVYRY